MAPPCSLRIWVPVMLKFPRMPTPRAAAIALLFIASCHRETADEGGASPAPAASPAPPASTVGCPAAWLEAPAVDSAIVPPSGNERIVLHVAATGSQNYACKAVASDGGTSFTWSLLGPEATLRDCHGATIGHHFATDTGAPEWQMAEGSYVTAHKLAAWAAGGGECRGSCSAWIGTPETQRSRAHATFSACARAEASRSPPDAMKAGLELCRKFRTPPITSSAPLRSNFQLL